MSLYPTERVLLFSINRPDIRVTVEAYFDHRGSLIVEGYDIGATVEDYWGDSDYEYAVTVFPEEVPHLCTHAQLPDGQPDTVLRYLQQHYGDNTGYSRFRTFLETHGIRHEGFSWR